MDLHNKISKLSKDELVELIMYLIDGDEDVEKKLEYKLISPDDEVKASKQLIRKYINENKWRGYISWRNVHASLQGADMVLGKGRTKLVNGEEETAIQLGLTVLSMVMDMLQYTDDSGGEIGFVVNRSISLLKDASSLVLVSKDYHVQDKSFELILKEAMQKRYDGFSDTRFDLLEVCTIYSGRPSIRTKLEETLEKLLSQVSKAASWSVNYEQQAIRRLQLKVMETNGEFDQVGQFIYQNLQYSDFRKMAIEKELDESNFDAALKLCQDGEKNDSMYPGLVKDWKSYRLQIYERQDDTEKQKELLLDFVYANDYESYAKLKDLCSKQEWETVVEQLFDTFEKRDRYLPNVYQYIAQEENRTDKLLLYCEKSPITIMDLYPYLLDDYPDRAEEIFTAYLQKEAEAAGNRKQYRNVCKKLKRFHSAFGDATFAELVAELKRTYERKPAFVNELEKVEI
ncbi:hypothetical protein [Aquibacillus salsiterrae]|uniref:Uncharacterized protein n=1 Tax=Aquibacillus salsiterrae TaxID=2950439 RepID=A0A9X4AG25_9BACI|nr:hypothetical protein [Aquibacillus salsiterrae]MDC3418239.1 hypothetical protein [Aquibacillus salsiterrae]